MQPVLGTNPISLAAPAGPNDPFVLDMATTTVALGKVRHFETHCMMIFLLDMVIMPRIDQVKPLDHIFIAFYSRDPHGMKQVKTVKCSHFRLAFQVRAYRGYTLNSKGIDKRQSCE